MDAHEFKVMRNKNKNPIQRNSPEKKSIFKLSALVIEKKDEKNQQHAKLLHLVRKFLFELYITISTKNDILLHNVMGKCLFQMIQLYKQRIEKNT